MTTRLFTAILCCFVATPMVAIAQESKDLEAIQKCFDDYLQAKNWEKKRDLMTEDAWVEYTMANLYAKRQVTESEINQLGLQKYRLPDLPADYKYLPDRTAIDSARKITKSAYADLSSKLGSKFLSLVERVSDATPKGNPKLEDIKILDDKIMATAEVRVDGVNILVPMNFKKISGHWRFDGKNKLLFFDRQR